MKKHIQRLSEKWRDTAHKLKKPLQDGRQETNSRAMVRALELEDCADQLDQILSACRWASDTSEVKGDIL